jgi:hypothetical protein
MPNQNQSMEDMAKRVQIALDTSDLSAFRELLDPDVKWGAPHARNPTCKNRDQVIAWYQGGKMAGVEGRVSEIEVLGECLLVCLTVRGTEAAKERGGSALRWQVQTVRNGRVIDIVGFDDRNDAIAYAETPLHSR